MSGDLPIDLPDEIDDIQEQADIVGFLTPREYARLRGMAPQMVYYYIRTGVVKDERCKCGRRVVEVRAADEALQTQARVRGRNVDTRSDADRTLEGGQGSPVQGVSQDTEVEGHLD